MNRVLFAAAAVLLWSVAMFGAGWAWRGDRAERDDNRGLAQQTREAVNASEEARQQDQQRAQAAQAAGDKADNREAQIDADYEKRLQAALAGRDADHERMRQHWAASCATDRLSSGAAAAAEAAEQDRLRRASAARVLRAVDLAQSERDECVDRYGAIAGTVVTP